MTERRRTADAPRVIVVDIGVDAALYSEPGNRVLVLRPGQTFNNAVAAAQRCLPDSHPDTIRTIVRTNLPGAPDFDPPEAAPVRATSGEPEPTPTRWPWRKSLIPILAAALAVVVVGAFGVVRAISGSADGPFTDEAFAEFARRGEFVCHQTGELQATCTDPRGGVLVSEATIGPRSVVYMFSYGERRVGLRVFADAKSARSWASNPPTQEMYRGVRAQGRFVLWGNDAGKIDYYVGLLKDSAPSAGKKSAGTESDANAADEQSGEPVALGDPNVLAAPAESVDRLMARAPTRDVYAPSSDGLPASLGAVMMATLGVGAAEADRAAEDGLASAMPPVQVLAVRLTLGMPGSADAEPGDEGPSDDAPIDEPTEEPTATDDESPTPDSEPTPEPTPQPTSADSEPTPEGSSEPTPDQPDSEQPDSERGESTPSEPAPAEPTATPQDSPPAESPSPEPQPTTTSESPAPAETSEPTSAASDDPEPAKSTPSGTGSDGAPSNSAPSDSAPSDSAPSDSGTSPSSESPIPTTPESMSAPLGVVSESSEPSQRRS